MLAILEQNRTNCHVEFITFDNVSYNIFCIPQIMSQQNLYVTNQIGHCTLYRIETNKIKMYSPICGVFSSPSLTFGESSRILEIVLHGHSSHHHFNNLKMRTQHNRQTQIANANATNLCKLQNVLRCTLLMRRSCQLRANFSACREPNAHK
jgi:hypothetical protein